MWKIIYKPTTMDSNSPIWNLEMFIPQMHLIFIPLWDENYVIFYPTSSSGHFITNGWRSARLSIKAGSMKSVTSQAYLCFCNGLSSAVVLKSNVYSRPDWTFPSMVAPRRISLPTWQCRNSRHHWLMWTSYKWLLQGLSIEWEFYHPEGTITKSQGRVRIRHCIW